MVSAYYDDELGLVIEGFSPLFDKAKKLLEDNGETVIKYDDYRDEVALAKDVWGVISWHIPNFCSQETSDLILDLQNLAHRKGKEQLARIGAKWHWAIAAIAQGHPPKIYGNIDEAARRRAQTEEKTEEEIRDDLIDAHNKSYLATLRGEGNPERCHMRQPTLEDRLTLAREIILYEYIERSMFDALP